MIRQGIVSFNGFSNCFAFALRSETSDDNKVLKEDVQNIVKN